jgi:hypothetical protein
MFPYAVVMQRGNLHDETRVGADVLRFWPVHPREWHSSNPRPRRRTKATATGTPRRSPSQPPSADDCRRAVQRTALRRASIGEAKRAPDRKPEFIISPPKVGLGFCQQQRSSPLACCWAPPSRSPRLSAAGAARCGLSNQSSCVAGASRLLPSFARCSW